MSVRTETDSCVTSTKPEPTPRRVLFSALRDSEFARHDLGHQGNVLRKDAKLSFGAGNDDGIHIVRKGLGFGSDDFESKSCHRNGVFRKDDYSLIISMPPFI